MKTLLCLVAIMALATCAGAAGAKAPVASNCLTCHQGWEDSTGPSHQFEKDVHYQNGLGCADCHGGNPDADDMDAVRADKTFRGVPKREDIPNFCARCHSDAVYMHNHNPSLPVDQLEKYKTSIHGRRLLEQKDTKVATCVSCHTAHQIANAKMPYATTYHANIPATCGHCHSDSGYMAGYNIPTDQEKLYRQSVHGVALYDKKDAAAPACNDCHGNHGAAPPGVTSLSAVCGTCHAIEARLFETSPHEAAFTQQGLPLCETCHSNHGIARPGDYFLGFGDKSFCAQCHSQGDGSAASVQIDSMQKGLAALTKATDSARALIQQAAVRGMMTTDQEFALKDIDQLAIQARSSVHAFAVDSMVPKIVDGEKKAAGVQTAAAGLIHEYYFRRWGLGVSSGIITILALALFLKIRAVERRKPS